MQAVPIQNHIFQRIYISYIHFSDSDGTKLRDKPEYLTTLQ